MKKSDITKIKPGTKFSRSSYGTVVRKDFDTIIVKNEEGLEWSIGKHIFEAEFYTPDQYDEVKEVTRTDMAELIIGNPRIVMTVRFRKQPDKKDLVSAVKKLLDDAEAGGKRPSDRKLSSLLTEATAGEERTMIGRHHGHQDEFGRLQFTDMEATGHNLRTIDTRTVEEAIFGGVKYTLKG